MTRYSPKKFCRECGTVIKRSEWLCSTHLRKELKENIPANTVETPPSAKESKQTSE